MNCTYWMNPNNPLHNSHEAVLLQFFHFNSGKNELNEYETFLKFLTSSVMMAGTPPMNRPPILGACSQDGRWRDVPTYLPYQTVRYGTCTVPYSSLYCSYNLPFDYFHMYATISHRPKISWGFLFKKCLSGIRYIVPIFSNSSHCPGLNI